MNLADSYLLQLLIGLSLMLMQLTVKDKKWVHILFALFCGSIALMAAQKLSAEALGAYRYIFGMGACLTCNGAWLLSRAFFRSKNAISLSHVLFVAVVALLIIINQGIYMYRELWVQSIPAAGSLQTVIQELLVLFSSTMIVLTFWEGIRGWERANSIDKKQRVFFLIALSTAVLSVMIFSNVLPPTVGGESTKAWITCYASILMMLTTQVLILWRFNHSAEKSTNRAMVTACKENHESDIELHQQLESFLIKEQRYLESNLKLVDVAQSLNVSEYRISRAIKHQFPAANFNQCVNALRVEHAKKLLLNPENAHWPVMVIGLESGFSSVGPFTRAFKQIVGCSPGHYRKSSLNEKSAATA